MGEHKMYCQIQHENHNHNETHSKEYRCEMIKICKRRHKDIFVYF